ncbi:MAG TPA: hypothetical protein VHM67_06400 [Gemmatimonadaceae bacterium]|nr:hypothetical protein [Gemmatimonadaceae bacterium]
MTRGLLVVALAALLFPVRGARAQSDDPPRPRLDDAAADTNDWEAYYTRGMLALQRSPTAAEPYFFWAARLAPGRGEAHFGRWASFWRREEGLWRKYVQGDRETVESPRVARVDSLLALALHRNPFVDQAMLVILYAQLPGDFRGDARTVAFLKYAGGEYAKAAQILGKEIARHPARRETLGYDRALALVRAGQLDSATTELQLVLAMLRKRDARHTVRVYQSKELLEYAIGLLLLSRGDTAAARASMERALTENLAFAPAHDALARLALIRGDTATAVRERAQAVELHPLDGYLRQQYGGALLVAGRPLDALDQFRRAVELEPYYADPYYGIAAAHDLAGDSTAAAREYEDYLARAPRRASALRQHAERRLAALRAAGK